jgi:hypothetical protein
VMVPLCWDYTVLDLAQASGLRIFEFEAEQGWAGCDTPPATPKRRPPSTTGRWRSRTSVASPPARLAPVTGWLTPTTRWASRTRREATGNAPSTSSTPSVSTGNSLGIDRADEEETSVEAIRARLKSLAG